MANWNRWPPRGWEAQTPAQRPAVFTAIAGYITSALIGVGFSAAIAGATANLVIGVALTGISMLLSPRPPVMKTPQAQAVLNQSTAPRVRGYGYALLGGTRAFWDSRDGYLYQAVMMHSGEIDGIEQYRIGDTTVSMDGNGDVTTDQFVTQEGGRGGIGGTPPTNVYNVRIHGHLGASDQAADSMLVGAFPGIWTSAHRLRGISYFVSRFRSPKQDDFQRVFPEGYNTPIRALCRLSRVWDPRNNTTAFKDNAGLCILDYLTHPDGFKKSREEIDIPSFISFANLCDENVPLAAGGSEKRYRLWGVYSLNDEPEDILRKMRATCDAELYQNAQGKIAIRGGKWEAPTVTITERDILAHSMEQGNDAFAVFNELKIMYTSPQHDFQTMEATAWVDLADQDERGPIPSDLDLDFVPSPSQSRRLAKIHIAKSNPRWKGRTKTNLSGLNALGERTTRLILPELEIDDAFYVAGFSIAPDLTSVEIEEMTISEAAYQWNPATEEGQNPAIPQDTTPDLTFPVPQGLVLSVSADKVITATVDAAPRSGLELQVQIRAGAGSVWQEMAVATDSLSAVFGPVADGAYQVQARWTGALNAAGAWTFPYVEVDTTTAVPPPTELSAVRSGANVTVSWRNPNIASFSRARVWRATGTNPFSSAVEISLQYGSPNTVYSFVDAPGAGTWRYWVTAVNGSGTASPPVGPASVTVT